MPVVLVLGEVIRLLGSLWVWPNVAALHCIGEIKKNLKV